MYLYAIGPQEGAQKIGFSKSPKRRLTSLQTGHPQKLFLHHQEAVDPKRVRLLEKQIHKELNYRKQKGEWFNLTPQEASDLVRYFVIRHEDDPFLGI